MVVTNRETHRPRNIGNNRPHLCTPCFAMRPNNTEAKSFASVLSQLQVPQRTTQPRQAGNCFLQNISEVITRSVRRQICLYWTHRASTIATAHQLRRRDVRVYTFKRVQLSDGANEYGGNDKMNKLSQKVDERPHCVGRPRLKCLLSGVDPGPNLTDGHFDPPMSSTAQTTSRSVQTFSHSSWSCPTDTHRQTYRHSDHAASVTIFLHFVHAMRPTETDQCDIFVTSCKTLSDNELVYNGVTLQ